MVAAFLVTLTRTLFVRVIASLNAGTEIRVAAGMQRRRDAASDPRYFRPGGRQGHLIGRSPGIIWPFLT
jgi:hypothetical protein